MSFRATIWILGIASVCLGNEAVRADAKTKAIRETAEAVMARFGVRAGRSLPALAEKIESLAARYGDEALVAIRRVGPEAFTVIEEAGVNAPRAVRLLAKYGEEGATCVLRRPRAMRQFVRYGEEAASVLVKHPGVAEPLIEQGGASAVRALVRLTPQGARRMAMVLEGELKTAAGKPELMEVIARYGQRACDFVWRNKKVLAAGAALAAFLADPEPYLNGVRDLLQAAGEPVVKPVLGGVFTTLKTALGMLTLLMIAIAFLIHKYGLPVPKGLLAHLLLSRFLKR